MRYVVVVLLALLIPCVAQAGVENMFVPSTDVVVMEDGSGRAVDSDGRVLNYCEAEAACDGSDTAGSDNLKVIDSEWPRSMFVAGVDVTLYEDGSGRASGEDVLLFCLQDWQCDNSSWPVTVYMPLIGK